MAFTFPTSANQLQAFAGALYGVQIGSTTMAQVTSDIAAVGGLDTALNSYYAASFSGVPTASVAASVASNLGLTGDLLTAGTTYVAAQLNAAAPSARGVVIKNILSLFSNLASDATFGAAATAWNNKVAAAAAYKGTTDVTMGSTVSIDQTFTLTAGVDIKKGTDGIDTFDGSVNANGTSTLTSVDQLDGAGGEDMLIAGLAGGNIATKLSNIESGQFITSAATTFDLVNTTGMTSLLMRNSSAALTINNIPGTTGPAISVQDQASDFNLNFANAGLAGANTFTLGLSGAQSDGDGGAAVAIAQQAGTDTSALETLTLNSGGSNTNFLASVTAQNAAGTSTVTKLTTTGAQGLNVRTDFNGSVRTIDASGMTGSVGLTAGFDATLAVTVTGSAGNDTLTFDSNAGNVTIDAGAGNDVVSILNFTTADSINGGDGTADRLDIRTSAEAEGVTANLANVSGFEQLSLLNEGTANAAITASRFGAIDTVRLDKGTLGTYALTMQAGAVNVQFASPVAASNALLATATLTINDTGTAATDALTITNRDTDTTSATDNFNGASITVNGYETVTINAGAVDTLAVGNQDINAITLAGDSLTGVITLNVTGANSVDVAGAISSNSSGLLTVDASGLTGTAAFVMATAPTFSVATGTVSLKGSANNDTLLGAAASASTIDGGAGRDSLVGGSAADNISGGAGNDTITAGGGNDVVDAGEGNDAVTMTTGTVNVTGGAGNDTIDMAATLTQNDTVAGGDGTDTLSLAAAATAANAAGVSGFETFSVDAAFNQGMEQFTNNTGFTRINYNVSGNVAITNASASVDTIQLQATGAGNAFSLARLVDTSANALNIVMEDTGANATAAAVVTLTANDEETLTINTGTTSDNVASNGTGEALTISTLNASDLTTLTVSGANAVIITNPIGGAANLATVNAGGLTAAFTADASTSTANLTFTGSFAASNVFTGGTGADSLTGGTAADTLTGGNGADTITAGAGADVLVGGLGADSIMGEIGNDTITGGVGNDTLSGGEGADTFRFDNALNGVDTITDFVVGTDKLNVTTNTVLAAATEVAPYTGAANNTQVTVTDNNVFYVSMNGAAGNLFQGGTLTLSTADMTAATLTNLAGYLDEKFNGSTNNTDDAVFVINWTAGGSSTSYVYEYIENGGAPAFTANELTLIGVVSRGATTPLTTGDVN
jgi:RTX calcium-binding nonapeptide repeat (4 copies)